MEKGNYRIKFEVNSKLNELYLDFRGNVLRYHKDLWGSEVPENIIKTLESKVKFFDLNDADLFHEGKEIYYEINFEIDGKDHDFWIDEKSKQVHLSETGMEKAEEILREAGIIAKDDGLYSISKRLNNLLAPPTIMKFISVQNLLSSYSYFLLNLDFPKLMDATNSPS